MAHHLPYVDYFVLDSAGYDGTRAEWDRQVSWEGTAEIAGSKSLPVSHHKHLLFAVCVAVP